MQCSSLLGISRCINFITENSLHCELHREKAKQLYLKYKKYSASCKNLKFNVSDEKNLLDCYILLNKAYNSRMKHRKYHIIEEIRDKGHDYQLEKLMNQINLCEKYLVDITNINYSLYTQNIENTKNKEDKEDDSIVSIVNIKTKKRKIVLEDYEELVNNYILENEKHKEEKHKLISYLFVNILSMFCDENDEVYIVHKIYRINSVEEVNISKYGKVVNNLSCYIWNCIFQLIYQLKIIGFFENKLEHDSYRIILNPKSGIDSYDDKGISMDYFVTNFSKEALKNDFECALLHKTKIAYLSMNIIYTILKQKNSLKNELVFRLLRENNQSIFELLTHTSKIGKNYSFENNRTNLNKGEFDSMKY
jgi:hypothetical protein